MPSAKNAFLSPLKFQGQDGNRFVELLADARADGNRRSPRRYQTPELKNTFLVDAKAFVRWIGGMGLFRTPFQRSHVKRPRQD